MEVGFFIKDHGEGLDDTVYIPHDYLKYAHTNLAKAEACAEYGWAECDGMDWMYPTSVFTLVEGDEVIGDFEVTVDFDPVFSAREKKEND